MGRFSGSITKKRRGKYQLLAKWESSPLYRYFTPDYLEDFEDDFEDDFDDYFDDSEEDSKKEDGKEEEAE